MAICPTERRAGFSLLEIILAMAVLAGSLAMLGEAASLAMRNAKYTRDMSRAQSLCESTLDEIIAGFIPPDTAQQVPVEVSETDADLSGPGWFYSIEQLPVDDEVGLLSLRVTVTQDLPPEKRPVSFSVTRWIADPNAATGQTDTGSSQTGSSDITPMGGSL